MLGFLCDRQLKLELIETQADRDSAINKIDRYKVREESMGFV